MATLTAGFPSTTATSLTSLGAGATPGETGIVGHLLRLPGQDHLFNTLRWRLHGDGHGHPDALTDFPPERVQPRRTVFQRAADAGVTAVQIGPGYQDGSGLSRASFRGGSFRTSFGVGDLVAGAADALRGADRALVYAYHPDLDTTGHARGPASDAWRYELAHTDRIAADIADRLPPGAALVVTADHGMIELSDRIDFDTHPDLGNGVAVLGGEPRARHVYTVPGAADDVRQTWTAVLGDAFSVLTRDEAVRSGWFGPRVSDECAARIGDLVVAARDTVGVVRSAAEPVQALMIGHHGSLTEAELTVPLRVYRA